MLKKFILITQVLLVTSGLVVASLIANNQSSNIQAMASTTSNQGLSNWQKAATIYPNYAGELANPNFYKLVDRSKSDGLNHVSIIVQYFQSDLNADTLYPAPYAPTDAELANALQYVKSQGMTSSIKIFTDVDYSKDTIWRAYISPTNRQKWFDNYDQIVTKYGRIAEANNVSLFSIGTEMIELSRDDKSPLNTVNWKKIISDLRGNFSGKVTYGLNAYIENDDLSGVKFLGDLDIIGISGYYSLSEYQNPTINTLLRAWSKIETDKIKPLVNIYKKPIMFTELGYRNVGSTFYTPWISSGDENLYNEQAQADAYQALIEFFRTKDYFVGWHIWNMNTNIAPANSGDVTYSPLNKQAEKVLQKYFQEIAIVSVSSESKNSSSSSSSTSSSISPSSQSSSVQTVSSSSSTPNPTVKFETRILNQNPVNISLVNNSGINYSNIILDFELFDDANNKVDQIYFENVNLETGKATSFSPKFQAKNGAYNLKVGIFSKDWKNTIDWNDFAGKIQIVTTLPSSSSISKVSSDSSQNSVSSINSSSFSVNSSAFQANPVSSSSSTPIISSNSSRSSSSQNNQTTIDQNWVQDFIARIMLGTTTFGALWIKK